MLRELFSFSFRVLNYFIVIGELDFRCQLFLPIKSVRRKGNLLTVCIIQWVCYHYHLSPHPPCSILYNFVIFFSQLSLFHVFYLFLVICPIFRKSYPFPSWLYLDITRILLQLPFLQNIYCDLYKSFINLISCFYVLYPSVS